MIFESGYTLLVPLLWPVQLWVALSNTRLVSITFTFVSFLHTRKDRYFCFQLFNIHGARKHFFKKCKKWSSRYPKKIINILSLAWGGIKVTFLGHQLKHIYFLNFFHIVGHKIYLLEMFYLNTIEQLFLLVEQWDQLEVCLPSSRLLAGILILAVFQNIRWNSIKTYLYFLYFINNTILF